MAALAVETPIRNRGSLTDTQISYLVATAATVYPGALVALNAAGFLIPYANAVGVRVLGIMNDGEPKVGTAAGVFASVNVGGSVLERVTVTGATGQTDVGAPVYGVTDNANDLSLTPAASQAVNGMVVRWYSATICDVLIYPAWGIVADA